jgi:hypothetical protein
LADGGFQIVGNATGTVNLATGATLTLGTTTGTGTLFPTNFTSGNITLNSSSTVIYNSNLSQNVAALNYGNLTFNSTVASSQKTLLGSVSVATTLSLTNSLVILGNNNLTVNNTAAAAVTGGTFSATNMMVADGSGQLIRAILLNATGTYPFPVGDMNEYSPVSLDFDANSVQRNVGVRVVDAQHPNDGTPGDYLSRYWIFSESVGTGTYTYTPTFTYINTSSDLVGTNTSLFLNRWNGTTWTPYTATNGAGTIAPSVVLNESTAPLASTSHFTGRINAITYTWTGGAGDGLWSSANNWSPSRSSTSVTDIMQFNSGGTITVTGVPAQTIRQLLVSNNTNVTLQAGSAVSLSVSGAAGLNNVDVASGSTLQIGGGAGALTLTYLSTGVTGQVANIAGSLILNTNGGFSSGIATTTVSVGGSLTLSGGTYTATRTATNVTGSLTYNSGTVTSTIDNLTFGEGGNYYHAATSGSIPAATWINTNSGSTCTVNAGASASSLNIHSNINVMATGTLNLPGSSFTVHGTITISGTLNLTSSMFSKTFAGDVIINSGGHWNNSGGTELVFGGNLQNNGTFTHTTTGDIWFTGTGKTISGSSAIFAAYAGVSGTITNNNTGGFNIGTLLTGGGTFTQGTNALLNIGTPGLTYSSPINNSLTLDASTNVNTVNYIGASQNLKVIAYHHLGLSGSGTKNMQTISTINGDFVMSANGSTTAGAALTIGGSVTLGGSAFTSGSFTHNVAGDFYYNSGTFTTTGSTFNFNGATTQTIGGTLAPTFRNLTINKTSGAGINLGNNVTVSNQLTLTNGILDLNNHNLNVIGSISSGGASSFIRTSGTGSLIRRISGNGTFTFPVGEPVYSPLTLTLSSGSYSSASIAVYTKDVKVTGLNNIHVSYLDRHWSVEPTGITNPSYSISYTYDDGDLVLGGAPEADLLPIKKSGIEWYKPQGALFPDGTETGTGSINTSTNTLSWNGLSEFSLFGGTVNAANPLPIELLSFSAECESDQSRLFKWQTASEHNNDFFTIEESVDGITWNILATIEGAGNSAQLIDYNYSYRMETLETGEIHYYRLKQTDFDGAFDYSGTISLSCDADWTSYFTNPIHGNTIEGVLVSPVKSIAEVKVYTATGQLIGDQVLSIKKGANLIEFTNQQLNQGIYLLRLHVENEVFMHKIMVSY